MLKVFLIIIGFNICYSAKSFDRQRTTLEAIKEFCLIRREDFCSKENFKYMFWNRPDDYIELMKSRQEFDRQNKLQKAGKKHKNGRDFVRAVIKELFDQLSQ